MPIASFFREMKRRRVFRVVAVYAVAAWAVMQVSDLVLPRLGAPDWVVTVVIVLAILGLPVVFALAWAFDITSDGIQRTPARAAQPDALPLARPQRALWFAGGIVVAMMIGWLAVKSEHADTSLDSQLIAVLPFRVGGADPSLKYLREGMIDLLAATLVSDDGTRAVDPPTALAKWKQAVKTPDEDLPVEAARAVARKMRAGNVVVGSIIGTPARLTLSLEVVDVASGKVRRVRTDGVADSLPQLVDRIAGQVLGLAAGEAERASLLAGVPLPAIRAYLAGMKAYRGGDYEEAGQRFIEAFTIDSMFVPAAMGVYTTNGWHVLDRVVVRRALNLAWASRDRLAPAERAIMIAQIGPHYPLPSSGVELLAAAREAVRIAPDRPESHNWVAEWLYHNGPLLGIEHAHDEAIKEFNRVLVLDPNLAGPREHIAEIAFTRGDTATVVRMADAALSRDSVGVTADGFRFLRAAVRRDEKTLREIRDAMPKLGFELLWVIAYHASSAGIALREADAAVSFFKLSDRGWKPAFNYELNRGRPALALKILADWAKRDTTGQRGPDLYAITGALFNHGDTAYAGKAVQRLAITMKTPQLIGSEKASPLCALAQWDVAHNRFDAIPAHVAALRSAATDGKGPLPSAMASLCADLLLAQRAIHDGKPEADRLLQRVDSVAATVPPGVRDVQLNWINLLLASAFEQRGANKAAMRALQRRSFLYGSVGDYLTTNRLMRARIAIKLGDKAAAIAAYQHYLVLMADAEPALRPEVEAARRELAQLTRDR